jgi:hypothetical protein
MKSESASLNGFGKWTAGRRSASGKGTTKAQNSYERTQHVIENKAHEFSEPGMYLKDKDLTKISQYVHDDKGVGFAPTARIAQSFAMLAPTELLPPPGSSQPEERARKNRKMKKGPTILLITKDRFWEPTMLMKIKALVWICHDVYENTGFTLPRFSLRCAARSRSPA